MTFLVQTSRACHPRSGEMIPIIGRRNKILFKCLLFKVSQLFFGIFQHCLASWHVKISELNDPLLSDFVLMACPRIPGCL